jgi:hypothetical protein
MTGQRRTAPLASGAVPYIFLAALVAALTFGAVSCRDIKNLEFTGLKGFTVEHIASDGIKGEVHVGIRNPNGFGFRIKKSVFDVSYAGVSLGQAKLAKAVRIRGNEERTYGFSLESDFREKNLTDVMKLLGGASRREALEVKGDLRAGTLFITRKFPLSLREPVKLK